MEMEETTEHKSNGSEEHQPINEAGREDAAKRIIQREFDLEVHKRSEELFLIENRITQARDLIRRMEEYCWRYNPDYLRDVVIPSVAPSSAPVKTATQLPKKKKILGNEEKKKLYARASDGTFVQLICPSCNKQHFQNKLGFMNHCRIIHQLKFTSFDDAGHHCGVPIEESQVPPDMPDRHIKHNFMPLNKNKNKRAKTEEPEMNPTPLKIPKVEKTENTEEARATTPAPIPVPTPTPTPVPTPAPPPPRVVDRPNEDSVLPDNVSRFRVKKKIIVGNVSRYIPPKSREEGDNSTHKWMVYVRGAPGEADLSLYVDRVRFFLDPSYKPNNIIEVTCPPFDISRRGWGEFPIRVQLHFKDKRNTPFNVVHPIQLDLKNTGLQQNGGETQVEVELDRRYFDDNSIPYSVPTSGVTIPEVELPETTHNLLATLISKFPLVRPVDMVGVCVYYSIARDLKEWKMWGEMRRRAIATMRARQIKLKINRESPGVVVTTKMISQWCVSHGHTPLVEEERREDSRKITARGVPMGKRPRNLKPANTTATVVEPEGAVQKNGGGSSEGISTKTPAKSTKENAKEDSVETPTEDVAENSTEITKENSMDDIPPLEERIIDESSQDFSTNDHPPQLEHIHFIKEEETSHPTEAILDEDSLERSLLDAEYKEDMLFDDSISDGDFSLKDMENHTQTSYEDILMDGIVDLDGNRLDLDVLGKDLDDGEFVEMSSVSEESVDLRDVFTPVIQPMGRERKVKSEDSDFEGDEVVEEVTKSTSINSRRRRSTAPITFVEEEEEEIEDTPFDASEDEIVDITD